MHLFEYKGKVEIKFLEWEELNLNSSPIKERSCLDKLHIYDSLCESHLGLSTGVINLGRGNLHNCQG